MLALDSSLPLTGANSCHNPLSFDDLYQSKLLDITPASSLEIALTKSELLPWFWACTTGAEDTHCIPSSPQGHRIITELIRAHRFGKYRFTYTGKIVKIQPSQQGPFICTKPPSPRLEQEYTVEKIVETRLHQLRQQWYHLLSSPGEPHSYGRHLVIVWEPVGSEFRLLALIHNREVTTLTRPTMARLLQELLRLLRQQGVYTGQPKFQLVRISELSELERIALQALAEAYRKYLNRIPSLPLNYMTTLLWQERVQLRVTRDFTLAPLHLDQGSLILVTGSYLCLALSHEDHPRFYSAEEGNLILISLMYNPDCWDGLASTSPRKTK